MVGEDKTKHTQVEPVWYQLGSDKNKRRGRGAGTEGGHGCIVEIIYLFLTRMLFY